MIVQDDEEDDEEEDDEEEEEDDDDDEDEDGEQAGLELENTNCGFTKDTAKYKCLNNFNFVVRTNSPRYGLAAWQIVK